MQARDSYKHNDGPEKKGKKPVTKAAPAAPAPLTMAGEDEYMKQLQEFVKYMTGPLDMNDPYVRQVVSNTSAAVDRSAQARGIQGPMAVNGVQGAVGNAYAGLDMQRRQMGLQGLGMVGGRYDSLAGRDQFNRNFGLANQQFNESRRQFDMGYGLQREQFAYNKQRDQAADSSNFWGTLGGVAGGLAGGVGGFFLGGPAGAFAGAQLGYGAGSSLGSAAGRGF